MFLVEKLSKDVTSSGSSEQTDSLKKSKSIKERIAENVKESLNRFWIPPYCKLNSLRIQEDGKLTIEVYLACIIEHFRTFFLNTSKKKGL